MHVHAAGLTDTGRCREHNEDSLFLDVALRLFVVADGMGGHSAGEVASREAVRSLVDYVRHCSRADSTLPGDFDPRRAFEENCLLGGVASANRHVLHISTTTGGSPGMGTTIVAAMLSAGAKSVWVAHVGDSRCYRIRGRTIESLTRDHSLLNDYRDAMPATSERDLAFVPRNVITRAVGLQSNLEVALQRHDALAGDVLVLCSDGLSGELDDAAIAATVVGCDQGPEPTARALIAAANDHGGEDNITVVIVRVGGAQT